MLRRVVQEQASTPARTLVLVAGFIHDLAPFLDAHPGGRALLATMAGKDATTAFFGGVYDHSNAAHNVSTSSSFSSFLLLLLSSAFRKCVMNMD